MEETIPKIPHTFAFNADDARAHMEALGNVHLVAIHRTGSPMHMRSKWFGTDYDAAIAWAEIENRDHKGLYVTINEVSDNFNKKPSDADIAECRFCHVDLDPPLSGADFPFDAVLETFETMRCPPSFVIKSGGGVQAWWRIEPSKNKESIRNINLQIRHLFNADACQDVSRLFRLAGTVNFVNAAKASRGRKDTVSSIIQPDNGTIYEPHELAVSFPPIPEHGHADSVERAHVEIVGVEFLTCDDLGLSPFNAIRVAVERPKGTDRSANVLHAACEMVRDGYDDDRIAGMLLNPVNAVSAHLLDQGDPLRAAKRVIGRARGEEPDANVVSDETREAVANIVVSAPKVQSEGQTLTEQFDWYANLTPSLKLMVDTVNTYAPSPRPELALGSAIAAFATAMGRRYQTPSGLLSNIYLVGLTPSGGGKDLPINAPAQALIACGQTGEKMVGGDIVSARGIMSAIETSPTLFIPADEVGKLIQAIQDPRGNLKDAVTVLLKMYSASQGVFKGAMYANSKERPTLLIHRPCLGFYGVSNPRAFWEKLTHSSISDGLLPRFILLPDAMPDTPPPRRLKRCVYPDALIDALRACMAGVPDHKTFPMGDGAQMPPKPFTVEYSDGEADDREYQMRLDQHAWEKRVEPDMVPFVKRGAENAQKLALVRAVSRCPEAPVLTADDLEWGWAISARSVEEFMKQAAGNISENETEARSKRVLAFIVATGEAGASTSEIGRKFQSIAGREREDILVDLAANGLVRVVKEAGDGRPRTKYFALVENSA